MMRVILAEKPSVARDIARVVGAQQKKKGYLEGSGYQVTWAFGHLVSIAEPQAMCKDWGGRWSFSQLPMIPPSFQLVTTSKGQEQFDIIAGLFRSCDDIINATDAGREGELIFRWIYQHAGCDKPFRRLWVSDLTDASIRQGLQQLHDGHDFDRLGASAQCRAFADWMVGLNATRAYTVRYGQLYTVGRVQTPTLALIVNRDKQIKGFEKVYYYELYAHTRQVPFRWEDKNGFKIEKKEKAEELKKRLEGLPGTITEVKKSKKKTSPPPLYDLTALQKECNERYGYSAKETLDMAQSLYEKHKLISYPRTESRHLSEKMRPELPRILQAAPDHLKIFSEKALQRLKSGHVPGKNYIDDTKLTDHHAIIPTQKRQQAALEPRLNHVYQLVQKRFMAMFYEDFVEDITEITMRIDKEWFKYKAAIPVEQGWREVYGFTLPREKTSPGEASQNTLKPDIIRMLDAQFEKGQTTAIDHLEIKEKETAPPKPFTDGTLLSAMRLIGRQVDDEALAAQLKEQGLGTQSTRAAIIERLIKSQYIVRNKKQLHPTPKAIRLIEMVVTDLKSPELTAQWEQKLREIQEGTLDDKVFMQEIRSFTEEIIPIIQACQDHKAPLKQKEHFGICPQCKQGQIYEGKKGYYCSRYRDGCPFILWMAIAGRKYTPDEVRKIIKDGRSDLITGLKTKSGRTFDAIVALDKNFKTKFCFK